MPSMEYHRLNNTDLASIIAYLRTLPEVVRENQASYVGPMGKVLFVLGKFPMMASSHSLNLNAPFVEKPEEGPTKEFGAYLAQTACVGCHSESFSGGPIAGAPPEWPEASDIRLGKNSAWTEENFFSAMRTGMSPTTSQLIRPPMPIALTSKMSDVELKALWLFLSSL